MGNDTDVLCPQNRQSTLRLTGYQARMLFRNFHIPIPEDLTTGDEEQSYQIASQQALQVAIVTDYAARCPVLKVSYITDQPPVVYQQAIDALSGLHSYQVNTVASDMDFPHEHWQPFVELCVKLYTCYTTSDAEQVEIKPLALVTDGTVLALNGNVVIDENALFRQPDLERLRDTADESLPEQMARTAGLPCATMPGQIGCLVNGAGLAMATMDLIDYYGAEDGISAASFVEIDSSDTPEQLTRALSIILSDLNVKAVLVNIFGGLARCDDVATSIVFACRRLTPVVPVVIRLQGMSVSEGRRIIETAHLPNVTCTETVNEAAWKSVATVKGSISHVHPD